jgi:hypothetical protein
MLREDVSCLLILADRAHASSTITSSVTIENGNNSGPNSLGTLQNPVHLYSVFCL